MKHMLALLVLLSSCITISGMQEPVQTKSRTIKSALISKPAKIIYGILAAGATGIGGVLLAAKGWRWHLDSLRIAKGEHIAALLIDSTGYVGPNASLIAVLFPKLAGKLQIKEQDGYWSISAQQLSKEATQEISKLAEVFDSCLAYHEHENTKAKFKMMYIPGLITLVVPADTK